MAKFDVLASITETRQGTFFVMVSIAPRLAWSASSELEEATAPTYPEAHGICAGFIAVACARVPDAGR